MYNVIPLPQFFYYLSTYLASTAFVLHRWSPIIWIVLVFSGRSNQGQTSVINRQLPEKADCVPSLRESHWPITIAINKPFHIDASICSHRYRVNHIFAWDASKCVSKVSLTIWTKPRIISRIAWLNKPIKIVSKMFHQLFTINIYHLILIKQSIKQINDVGIIYYIESIVLNLNIYLNEIIIFRINIHYQKDL